MQQKPKQTKFLGKGLLTPNLKNTDATRAFMGVGALSQMVNLKKAEPPLIFTGYENNLAEYSSSLVRTDRDYKLVKIIAKNSLNKDYLLQEVNNPSKFSLFKRRESVNITESYGYHIINDIDNFVVGSIIPSGTILKRTGSFDELGNIGYGLNLNVIMIPFKGLTYEDSIVISESAAKKLTHHYVHKIDVTINTNDLLLNLYGDKKTYKCFPNIGEYIKDGVLLARRKLNFENFKNYSNENLMNLNSLDDDIFYANGKVVDIKVFSNIKDTTKISKYQFNNQILKYLNDEESFYDNIIKTYDMLSHTSGNQFDDVMKSEYVKGQKFKDHNYFYESHNFDMFVVRFYVEEEVSVKIGSKLTAR